MNVNARMTLRSLGRPWFTRRSVGYIRDRGQFHWTERAAHARYGKLGGQILHRRGLYWDFPPRDGETDDATRQIEDGST